MENSSNFLSVLVGVVNVYCGAFNIILSEANIIIAQQVNLSI